MEGSTRAPRASRFQRNAAKSSGLALEQAKEDACDAEQEAAADGDDFAGTVLKCVDRGAWRERLAAMTEAGATEVAYQPAGPDIPRELEAFADACNG